MTRSLLAALAVLLLAPVAQAQQLAALGAETFAADEGIDAHASEVGDDEAVDDAAYDEEELDEEVEFCGGGEESVVDLAFYELEADNPEEARRMLVEALREGQIEDWQRGPALVTLAEAQLRSGQPGAAAMNYRKALAHDDVGVEARVGLATALLLRDRPRLAYAEASAARDEVCSSRWAQAACYAAQQVVARTSRASDERASAREAAAGLRASHADLGEVFDSIDARLAARDHRS